MSVQYSTTDFLNTVRLRGSIPNTTNSSNVNNTANLLQMATDELLIKLLPLIMAAREEFYVTSASYTITSGQANYPIPYRAVGQVIRDIHIIQGNAVYRLKPIEPEFLTTTTSSDVLGYYFEDNNIVLYPTPGSSTLGTLKVRYFQRPSQLAATSDCAQITAVSGTTLSVSSFPSTWGTGTVVDFVNAAPPYRNSAVDQTVTGVSGTTFTFASLPTNPATGANLVSVGDWIALAEYTPIPQVPREFQPVLAQMTVVKVLQAQGDAQGAMQAMADLQILQSSALSLITQRNEGDVKKVISRNWFRR